MTEPARALPRYSYAEYRSFENSNPARHEFVDGQILAMAGGTPAHARLQAALLYVLERQLEGQPCQAFPSDLRVRIVASGLATYPDVSVICGDIETAPEDPNAAVNPVLVIEVLSDITESWDRGEKFEHYRKIASLHGYVLVSHRERRVDLWWRDPQGPWHERRVGSGETLDLPFVKATLVVDEIYDRSPLTRSL